MDFEILPWLLNWPPSRWTIAVFLVVTAASLGTIAVLGGPTLTQSDGNVTVHDVDLSIRLNDDVTIPDTDGTVNGCLGSGTPGDHLSVRGEVTVSIPAARSDAAQAVVLQLNGSMNRTVATIERAGNVTNDVFWVLEDDETFSVGDNTTVEVRVQEQGTTVASRTLSVPVENGSRSYDC
jgi:hypothetical protein